MSSATQSPRTPLRRCAASGLAFALFPTLTFAQANVFEQGATNLITELTLFALPFAILAVMAVGILAAVGRISWSWPIGVLLGIALLFGAPQIVGWIRNVFLV